MSGYPPPAMTVMGDLMGAPNHGFQYWNGLRTWMIWSSPHGLETSISIQFSFFWTSGKPMKNSVDVECRSDLFGLGSQKLGDHRGNRGEMGLLIMHSRAEVLRRVASSIFKHQVQGHCCDREPIMWIILESTRVRENRALQVDQVMKTTPSCSQALKSVRLWWKPVEAAEPVATGTGMTGTARQHVTPPLQAAIRGRRVDLLQVPSWP